MLPTLHLSRHEDRERVEKLLNDLRLNPAELAVSDGRYAHDTEVVEGIIAEVSARGDNAIVDSARKFDFLEFTSAMIQVSQAEMSEAVKRVPADQLSALRRSIAHVVESFTPYVQARAQSRRQRSGAT